MTKSRWCTYLSPRIRSEVAQNKHRDAQARLAVMDQTRMGIKAEEVPLDVLIANYKKQVL